MELADAVRQRRMIRSYDPERSVPRQTIEMMLRMALRAPSAGHTQGWRFLVLDDITSLDRFWSATTDAANEADAWLLRMRTAPALVIAFSSKQAYLDRYAEPDKGWTDRDEARWPVPYWHIDVGMASMILLLGAVDAGLGACFFGVPPDRWQDLRTAFAVPAEWDPVGVVSLGYPAPDLRSPSLRRGRKAWDEVVRYGSFS